MSSKDACLILQTVKQLNMVTKLNFQKNLLDDGVIVTLGDIISCCLKIEKVSIASNQITDNGIEQLVDYVRGNTTMKELSLKENKLITDASIQDLSDMIQRSGITKLSILSTSISVEQRKEVERLLSIPIEKRDITIKSNAKSAAKASE